MTPVVLAADPVQALHVDRVGSAYGRLQFGAAGNAVLTSCRHCSEKVPGLVGRFPGSRCLPRRAAVCYPLVWNGFDSNGHQSIPCRHLFQSIGMDTIGMDTYPLIAGGTGGAADTADEYDRMLPLVR